MKEKMSRKFKKGVASFYIVAFSTLILVIVASSFAMVILSEVTRTSNDDLSQSAYDSALAGVEDAKLAFSNYQRCIEAGFTVDKNAKKDDVIIEDGTVTCEEIIWWMDHPDCDMVGHILGRYREDEKGEVEVTDTLSLVGGGDKQSDLNQAYTCVELTTQVDDYRSTLTTTNQTRMVKVSFDDEFTADKIQAVKISWYSNRADSTHEYSNFISAPLYSETRVAFQPATTMRVSTPPTLELQLVQTAGQYFTLESFDISRGNQTNRATLYLVPSNNKTAVATSVNTEYYLGSYNGSMNVVSAAQVTKTNDRTIKNKPFGVYCDDRDAEFACTTVVNLPRPVDIGKGSARNNDTFMFALSLPYSQPDTDFSLEFCTTANCIATNADGSTTSSAIAGIKDSQVVIDSTGRANDLYRRVEVRLESADTSFAYPYYAIQLLDDDSSSSLDKEMTVTSKGDFYF